MGLLQWLATKEINYCEQHCLLLFISCLLKCYKSMLVRNCVQHHTKVKPCTAPSTVPTTAGVTGSDWELIRLHHCATSGADAGSLLLSVFFPAASNTNTCPDTFKSPGVLLLCLKCRVMRAGSTLKAENMLTEATQQCCTVQSRYLDGKHCGHEARASL